MAHQRKNGMWRVRWRAQGKQKAKDFDSKKAAEKFEAELKLGLKAGLEIFASSKTFRQYAEIWFQDHCLVHKAPTSQIEDRRHLDRYLIPAWGTRPVMSLGASDLASLQGLMTRLKLSPKSINNTTGLAKKLMNDAVEWGIIPKNPFVAVKRIKEPEKVVRFWTMAERDRFLAFAKSRDTHLWEAVTFAVNTGLRLGEQEGLLIDTLDWDRREITVRRSYNYRTKSLRETTKSGRIRRVPMNRAVWSVIKDRRLMAPNEKVFPYKIRHMGFDRLAPMCHTAGVSVIRWHDLRHTFASQLAMAGVPIMVIKELLGHADIKQTLQYAHLSPDHFQGVTEVLAKGVKNDACAQERAHWRK